MAFHVICWSCIYWKKLTNRCRGSRNNTNSHGGVTRVGVIRDGNSRCQPYFFLEKKLTTFFAHHLITVTFIHFTGVSHPLEGVTRTILPLRPHLSTILCKFSHNFFLRVSPPWRGHQGRFVLRPHLVTPLLTAMGLRTHIWH